MPTSRAVLSTSCSAAAGLDQGDPLGIKPCIPIEMKALKHVIEVATLGDNRTYKDKLDELVTFLTRQLRHQEYVQTLYLRTVEGTAG